MYIQQGIGRSKQRPQSANTTLHIHTLGELMLYSGVELDDIEQQQGK